MQLRNVDGITVVIAESASHRLGGGHPARGMRAEYQSVVSRRRGYPHVRKHLRHDLRVGGIETLRLSV